MITQLFANNFKRLDDVDINFVHLNEVKKSLKKEYTLPTSFYIIGPNASGKSTILEIVDVFKKIYRGGTISYTPHHSRVGEPMELAITFLSGGKLYKTQFVMEPDGKYNVLYFMIDPESYNEDDDKEYWEFTEDEERYDDEYEEIYKTVESLIFNTAKSRELSIQDCLDSITDYDSLNRLIRSYDHNLRYDPSLKAFYRKYKDKEYKVSLTLSEESLVKLFYDRLTGCNMLYDDVGLHGSVLQELPSITFDSDANLIMVSSNKDAVDRFVRPECLIFTNVLNDGSTEIICAAEYVNLSDSIHSLFMNRKLHSDPFISPFIF